VFNPERHRRRSLRLAGFDYRLNGAYFVTICVQNRSCLFGEIVDEAMQVNDPGTMVHDWWDRLPTKWPGIDGDAMAVMPNHIHAIIVINDSFGLEEDVPRQEIEERPLIGRGNPHVVAPFPHVLAPSPQLVVHPREQMARISAGDGGKGDHTGSPLPDGRSRPALGDVVAWFKTMTTNAYIRGVKERGWEPFLGRLWQRNYYEHIIRSEQSLDRIRAYIEGNPARWIDDEENPDRIMGR
jgi:REP element-mobilizing transposase RayT